MSNYGIVDYQGGRNADVATLIFAIQRDDVGLEVPIEEQPELLGIRHAYHDGEFWLAMAGDEIVGTIGVMRYGLIGVLKKLFVRQDHRGPGGASTPATTGALTFSCPPSRSPQPSCSGYPGSES